MSGLNRKLVGAAWIAACIDVRLVETSYADADCVTQRCVSQVGSAFVFSKRHWLKKTLKYHERLRPSVSNPLLPTTHTLCLLIYRFAFFLFLVFYFWLSYLIHIMIKVCFIIIIIIIIIIILMMMMMITIMIITTEKIVCYIFFYKYKIYLFID